MLLKKVLSTVFCVSLACAIIPLSPSVSAMDETPPPSDGGDGGNDGGGNDGGGNSGDVRGPDPTARALEADRGPYSVDSVNVSLFADGFGGGTIFYPTNAGDDMGVIAVVPGYVSYESSIEWWGPRIASWGFVVVTIDTNTPLDTPNLRASQLEAALDYTINESNSSFSPLNGLVDSTRLGAIGWSMGGGGSLELATRNSNIKAIIPQAPWYSGINDFNRVDAATFFIACESDLIAPVASHVDDFWDDVPNSTPKMYIEINNGDHFCANSGNRNEDLLGKIGVSWMKRFIDGDTRFEQFLCPTNYAGGWFSPVSEQRNNCRF